MGWMMGIEPTTFGTTTRRSNQLSYTHQNIVLYYQICGLSSTNLSLDGDLEKFYNYYMEMTSISPDLIRGKIDALILRCVFEGECYGAQITKFVQEASGGTYVLKKPTLYSALKRLESRGQIIGDDRVEDGIRKRYYNLTETGKNYFMERKDDWRFGNDVISTVLYGEVGKRKVIRNHDVYVVDGSSHAVAEEIPQVVGHIASDAITSLPQVASESQENVMIAASQAVVAASQAVESVAKLLETEGSRTITNNNTTEIATTHLTNNSVTRTTESASLLEQFFARNHTQPAISEKLLIAGAASGFDLPLCRQGGHVSKEVESAPLRSYALASTPPTRLETSTLELEEAEPKQHVPHFDRYLGPNEYVVWNKPEYVPPPSVTIIDPSEKKIQAQTVESDVFVLEYHNNWANRKTGRFLLYNRLRAVTAVAVTAVLALLLAISWTATQGTGQAGEGTAFMLGFVALGVYLAINMAVLLVYPRLKKKHGNYKREFLVRLAISASLVVAILGSHLVAGLTATNMGDYFVFFLVPALLSLVVLLEGIGIYSMKRLRVFQV